MASSRRPSPLMIASTYAAFAGLWILLSDRVVERWFHTPTQVALVGTFKGYFFVACTTLLLFALLRRHWPESLDSELAPAPKRKWCWPPSRL